ncbi:MAG: Crp/Fnr family transcriptional regulator [Candidatus Dormibacteria bacterium]
MHASVFTSEFGRDLDLHELVNSYLRTAFAQLSEAVACNRLHSSQARLSGWLLTSGDSIGCDEVAITPEFLSQLLGSSPAAVSRSARILRGAGLIRYDRGHVAIVDRAGHESIACECYGVIRTELDGVVRRARLRSMAGGAPTASAPPADAKRLAWQPRAASGHGLEAGWRNAKAHRVIGNDTKHSPIRFVAAL